MQRYLTPLLVVALVAFVLVGSANSKPRQTPPRIVTIELAGNPKAGSQMLKAGTVPQGKTWTIKHASICAEKHSGELPRGGEFTISLHVNPRKYSGEVLQASTETGNRVKYEHTDMNVTLPPGTQLTASLWLGQAPYAETTGGLYFYAVLVLIEERQL